MDCTLHRRRARQDGPRPVLNPHIKRAHPVCRRLLVALMTTLLGVAGCNRGDEPAVATAGEHADAPGVSAANLIQSCSCTDEERRRCAALGQVCSAFGEGGQCQKRCVDAATASPQTAEQGNASLGISQVASAAAQQGPGMLITFQSCGYQATGLKVSCRNGNTGGLNEQLLYVGDTSPASCGTRLVTACNAVGYRTEQQGATVLIFGTGITVQAVGPVFTAADF